MFEHEWDMKISVTEEKFNEQIEKKNKNNQE